MKKIEELNGKFYITCSACMSVLADGLSWANANPDKIVKNPEDADNIIILSCQVTDLAVLNDFRTAERLGKDYPKTNIFISGCLANREDIELPFNVERLEPFRSNYQPINDRSLVNFEKPFWVTNFEESNDMLADGNIFRNKYPLRIGKGCPFKCAFCTIRVTRGEFEQYDIDHRLIEEFLNHDDVLLIADSPTKEQIIDWCKVAIKYKKKISIRNIEPQIAIQCEEYLIAASILKLLDVFHCPIQSNNLDILKDMNRHVNDTFKVIDLSKKLKEYGTKIATNVILDYKDFPNDFKEIKEIYDYVSWNPLWDRVWDRSKAEERFEKYIINSLVNF